MALRSLKKVAVFALLGALLLPVCVHAEQPESFYQQLADLLEQQKHEVFFDEMVLTIGSELLIVDGVEYQLDTPPEVQNERTMLPFRAVAEAMGARVEYDAQTQQVKVVSAWGDVVLCPLGDDSITVNGQKRVLDVAAYIKDGQFFLPLRAVAEALGLDVEWRQESGSVILTAPYQTARLVVYTEKLDTSELDAETVLTDGSGLWVLQFSTPLKAKKADEFLASRGILSGPDRQIAVDSAQTAE